jgi:two-component system OmpR family sensor kinase
MKSELFPSEKRSLRRFLAIYLLSSLFLIGAGSVVFYRYAYHRIIDHQNETLKIKTSLIKPRLHALHISTEPTLIYPHIDGIRTALFDIDGNYLVGEFRPKRPEGGKEFWQEDGRLYHAEPMQPYYLGAATIVSESPIDEAPIRALQIKMATGFVLAMIFVAFVSHWLGRLFLAPVHRTMDMLDRFIKDSTHELNTPVSTILTNIELFKSLHPDLESSEELRRIEIASKRLSRIYDDLAYLQLNHRRHRRIEPIDLGALLKERLEYFTLLTERRRLRIESDIESGVTLEMDREDAARLIDNLLSNAVKYTPPGRSIRVVLNRSGLWVEDTGIGMDESVKKRVTERFFRGNGSEGGFGLGLNIVREIVEFYGMELEISSQKEIGTKVGVTWRRK